jgi:hypothetical protein
MHKRSSRCSIPIALVALSFLGCAPAAGADQNPCVQAAWRGLRCPDLVMSRPADVALDTVYGRKVLRSGSSINSVGAGPAELDGTRYAPFLMHARQRIFLQSGGSILVATPATLRFKLIPGQGGYWKLRDAATMQLWALSAAGRQTRLVRVSPKLHYCLRDLKLTHPQLPGAPQAFVHPGCNQDPSITHVNLGTSVGWSDVYPASYYEQWIDVTGLRGRFALVHVADPENVIYESNETNNAARVIVDLPSGRVVG